MIAQDRDFGCGVVCEDELPEQIASDLHVLMRDIMNSMLTVMRCSIANLQTCLRWPNIISID